MRRRRARLSDLKAVGLPEPGTVVRFVICPNCQDKGWVCESHPDRPWDKDLPNGCECNAGMPCPVCGGDFKDEESAEDNR